MRHIILLSMLLLFSNATLSAQELPDSSKKKDSTFIGAFGGYIMNTYEDDNGIFFLEANEPLFGIDLGIQNMAPKAGFGIRSSGFFQMNPGITSFIGGGLNMLITYNYKGFYLGTGPKFSALFGSVIMPYSRTLGSGKIITGDVTASLFNLKIETPLILGYRLPNNVGLEIEGSTRLLERVGISYNANDSAITGKRSDVIIKKPDLQRGFIIRALYFLPAK